MWKHLEGHEELWAGVVLGTVAGTACPCTHYLACGSEW